MRVVVIGGTGHVGTFLIPRLVAAGHEVISISRGERQPYQAHPAWAAVRMVSLDRAASESAGCFARQVREIKPDAVIDMICFTLESVRQLAETLRGAVQLLAHCGSIWVHGPSVEVPTTEDEPRRPFGEYGIRKAQIEAYLLDEAKRNSLPATVLHPGHIVGPGWTPLNPAGHFHPRVFEQLGRGEELALPNLGMETVHHVHADDVAHAFVQTLSHREAAIGQSFHVVSPAALTLRGYAEAVSRWLGREPRLKFMPWAEWVHTVDEQEAAYTWDHIAHSPNCSIAKAARLLEYRPRYSSLQAVFEAVTWLARHGKIDIARLCPKEG